MTDLSPLAGVRAHVALLFADICDYTSMADVNDPEVIEVVKRRTEALAGDVLGRFNGAITQFYGDGILAVFGLPRSSEHNSRLAIEAALELNCAARQLPVRDLLANGFELRLHTGVHAGLVFVRGGDMLHGRYELSGDAVNLAARLCSSAGRDEVLVSSTALQGVEGFFAAEAAQELMLKGKRVPVRAHRVRARSEARTRFEARAVQGLTPLVGRENELAAMTVAAENLFRGDGRLLVVRGPAGIGKTRLLEEFRARATISGALVLVGNCDGYGESAPLEPLLQMLRQAFGIQHSTEGRAAVDMVTAKLERLRLVEHVQAFCRLLALPLDDRVLRDEMTTLAALRALGDLLTALTRENNPVVLILDDWQWIDETSRRLWAHIAKQFVYRKLLVVIATRDGSEPDRALERADVLNLAGLSLAESRQMIRGLRARDLDIHVSTVLHQRSGGNPLFLEELCRSLFHTSAAQSIDVATIPSSLHELIQARVGRLSERQAITLQLASTMGAEFSGSVVTSAAERESVEPDLAGLVEAGLVYPTTSDDTFRFKHGLTRDVVYESVRLADRRRIHLCIARSLEQASTSELLERAESLAFHFRGSSDYDRAARYEELAGDKAAATSLLAPARSHYAAALAALDELPLDAELMVRWLGISAKWSAQCAYSPTRQELATLERSVRYASEINSSAAQAHNSHMLGWFHYVLGDYDLAISHYRHSNALAAKDNNVRLVEHIWCVLGQAHGAAGDYDEALECLAKGIELKRARSGSTMRGKAKAWLYAHALSCRAIIWADQGYFDRAEQEISEALCIVDGTGHAMEPSVLLHNCKVKMRRGHWQDCARFGDLAAMAAERVHSTYAQALSLALAGYARCKIRFEPEAFEQLRNAAEWLEARDFGLYLSLVHGCIAEIAAEQGAMTLARELAERALRRGDSGESYGQSMAHRVLAQVSAMQGAERSECHHHIQQALRWSDSRHSLREQAISSLVAAELKIRRGDVSLPMIAPSELCTAFQSMGMHSYAELAAKLYARPSPG